MRPLNEFELAKFAREVAMNIKNFDDLLRDWDLTREDYEELEKIEFFARARDKMIIEWNSAYSTPERIRLSSLALQEQGLPVLGKRILDCDEPLPGVVEAHKQLSRMGGIGDGKSDIPNSDRFVITINLGDDVKVIDKSIKADPNDTPEPRQLALKLTETADGKEMDPESDQPKA